MIYIYIYGRLRGFRRPYKALFCKALQCLTKPVR